MEVTRVKVGPLDPRHKYVSAPVATVTHNAHHWHACEIDEKEAVVRVLCKVRPRSILDDTYMYDRKPVDCPTCARRLLQIARKRT